MDQVRLGVIGCGGMANNHMRYFEKIEGLRFTAASDSNPDALGGVVQRYGVQGFDDGHALIQSGEVDAILIATPHYTHPVFSQAAFEYGVHVLTEKPVAVTALAAEETNQAYQRAKQAHPDLVYSAMFNLRTSPIWRRVRHMIESGQVGELIRVSWTVTTWFRTQTYYDSGGWRGTWKGEGGGVLINQCPHNLDLFQWFVGMPRTVRAMVGLGKHHRIEVEDDVVAMMTFDNGAVGTFITSTGEAPGVNRLEIAGDNGLVIVDDAGLRFLENQTPCRTFRAQSPRRMGIPAPTVHTIVPGDTGEDHLGVTRNFVNVILGREKELIAHGVDGIHGLELGNAMLMSGLQDGKPVDIPTPREEFDQMMRRLAETSTFQKSAPASAAAGMA